MAVEAATFWDNSWVMEAAAPDLEAADEAVGAATVWINSWVVEIVEIGGDSSSNSNNSSSSNNNNSNNSNSNCRVTELEQGRAG